MRLGGFQINEAHQYHFFVSFFSSRRMLSSLRLGTRTTTSRCVCWHRNVVISWMSSRPPVGNNVIVPENVEVEYKTEIEDILKQYESKLARRQAKVGVVVSDKNAKSISVQVEHAKYFPKYNKYMNKRRNIMAHDEEELAEEGDLVRIIPCRPMSRWKRFKLIDVLKKAKKL